MTMCNCSRVCSELLGGCVYCPAPDCEYAAPPQAEPSAAEIISRDAAMEMYYDNAEYAREAHARANARYEAALTRERARPR